MQKISFTTLSTPGLSVREIAALARKFGYDGVDLRVSKRAGELMPDAGSAVIRAVRSVLDGEGIEAAGLLCYTECPELPGAELTASLRDQTLRQLEIAHELGAQSIRTGGSMEHYGELRDALRDALPQAGGVDVVLQNHEGAFSAGECLTLIEELDHPRLSIVFSPDHCTVTGEDFRAVFPRLKGRTRKLFIADVKPEGGKFHSVLPGAGVVPLAESYEAVGGAAFDGWITLKYEKLWEPSLLGPEESLPYFIGRAPLWFPGWRKGSGGQR